VVLLAAQRPQARFVALLDLVLVALHKAQQRLVPHHRHAALVVCKRHKVLHQRVHHLPSGGKHSQQWV
jgi:hypothetical protein